MRTVLATLGILVFVVVVAETLAAAYAPRSFAGGQARLRYVPYIGHFSTMFVETLGQSSDGEPVWMLGGSALAGDDPGVGTSLPAEFRREAERRGRSLSIRNIGQPAFNINQTRILFEEMLLRQPPPSVAIFYVGGSQDFSSLAGVGFPFFYTHFKDRIERRLAPDKLRSELAREPFRLPFLINYLFNRRVVAPPLIASGPYNPFRADGVADPGLADSGVADPGLDDPGRADLELVAAAIADSFAQNVRLLQGSCSAFGVRCFFYWQPHLCFKKTTTPYESKFLAGPAGKLCPQERLTHAAIQRHPFLSGNENFADLSKLFAEVSGPIFVDPSHMDQTVAHGQVGNRTLAQRLYSDIFAD